MEHLSSKISPQSSMRDLLVQYPGARRALFRRYHLGGCSSCDFDLEETLDQLCNRSGGLDAEQVLTEIEKSHCEDEKTLIDPLPIPEHLDDITEKIERAASSPQNMGEMVSADAIGMVGNSDCGDMLRLWIKFKEEKNGRRIIDRATFQSFGCQTAIAVASVATELIRGKTAEEALSLSGEELSAPLGALPPMKIHCAQLVEQALQSALTPTTLPQNDTQPSCSAPSEIISNQLHS